MAHYAVDAHVCPSCGTDNIPKIAEGVSTKLGVGMMNMSGIMSLPMVSGAARGALIKYPPLSEIFAQSAGDPLTSPEGLWESLDGFAKHLQREYSPPPVVHEVVDVEAGLFVSNPEAIARLELDKEKIDIRESIIIALGVPKEFLEGTPSVSYSTTGAWMRAVEERREELLVAAHARLTRPVNLDTEYVDGMEFREFWLRNFPRILALKLGPGPKRLRKKRLKRALGAAYSGHLVAGYIRERVNESSYAGSILPLEKKPKSPFMQEYQQEVQRIPHCAACGHSIDFHYRKNDPDKRLGPCRGHRTECECTAFDEERK